MNKYKIIALIGEAGSGKDFLLRCAKNKYPEYNEIISCTTRPKRTGEIDGKNYYFLTNEEFDSLVKNGKMFETANFNGWNYGTAFTALDHNKVNIGVFNPTGIKSMLQMDNIDLKIFYVRAAAKTRLLRQLNREDNPNCNEIIRRFITDEKDFSELNFEYTNL